MFPHPEKTFPPLLGIKDVVQHPAQVFLLPGGNLQTFRFIAPFEISREFPAAQTGAMEAFPALARLWKRS